MASSTQEAGNATQPNAEMASDMLCPKVKAVIHFRVGFHNEKLNGNVSASKNSI
jgi:hypothetical protein